MISKIAFSFIFLILPFLNTFAQQDTEFWFAAPEVAQHTRNFDRPVLLTISSMINSSTVTITLPANSNFKPVTINLLYEQTIVYDLTPFIELIENKPANSILNNGIYIKATQPVSIYYEVSSKECICNPEIFSLKGRSGLGTLFFTPFQNFWNNSIDHSPMPSSSFDIVATENETIVEITPTNDIVGHLANEKFEIILNKGQTYSATATSNLASKHLGGSKVEANKKIAITIKDDLVRNPFNGYQYSADLLGDQIVPVESLGREYIIPKGKLLNEKLFITSVEDETYIYINGNSDATIQLQQGGIFKYDLENDVVSINSNKPIYVLHVSGTLVELSASLMAPVEDGAGSRKAAFIPSINGDVILNIITKEAGKNHFYFNGNSDILDPSEFKVVPGSLDWYYASFSIPHEALRRSTGNIISNSTSCFFLGYILGGPNGVDGSRYAYLTNFNNSVSSERLVDLGVDKMLCMGEVIELDAGINNESYIWQDGSKESTFIAKEEGLYWVEVTRGCHMERDSVYINIQGTFVENLLNLENEKIVCEGNSVVLEIDNIFNNITWSTGSKEHLITVEEPGKYWVTVVNGCEYSADTIEVKNYKFPEVQIKKDFKFCNDNYVLLDASHPNATYNWQDGSRNQFYHAKTIGSHLVEITIDGCTSMKEIEVGLDDCPIYIPNIFTPNGDNVNDVFEVEGLNISSWELKIYNRWGKEIYTSKAYDNRWNGDNHSNGLYYYHFIHSASSKNIKGWVTILK